MDHINTQDIERNFKDREQIRKALAQKVEMLETRMRDNVAEIKESVRNSTDLKYQVGQRPWVMFGLSVLLGSVVGRLLLGNRQSSVARSRPEVEDIIRKGSDSTRAGFENSSANINLDQYGKHLSELKNAAVGALTSIFVQLARHVVPVIVTQIEKISKSWSFNSTTEKVRQADEQINDYRTSI